MGWQMRSITLSPWTTCWVGGEINMVGVRNRTMLLRLLRPANKSVVSLTPRSLFPQPLTAPQQRLSCEQFEKFYIVILFFVLYLFRTVLIIHLVEIMNVIYVFVSRH